MLVTHADSFTYADFSTHIKFKHKSFINHKNYQFKKGRWSFLNQDLPAQGILKNRDEIYRKKVSGHI